MKFQSLRNRLVNISLYLIPTSIALFTVVKSIVRDGMFIDGLAYANIAKNLSKGVGTVWSPLVDLNGPVFYEHPPLTFWLESFFFTCLGDGKYTEDIYNSAVLLLTLILLYGIWKEFVKKEDAKLFFFPLLGFLLSQEVQLRYANNLLECTLSVFALASVYLYFKFFRMRNTAALIGCGAGAFLCFLCKGPVGLFPLAVPFIHVILKGGGSKASSLLIPLVTCMACFGLLFLLSPASLDFLRGYLDVQVIAAIAGERFENISNSRFNILTGAIKLNLPFLILSAILYLVFRLKKSLKPVSENVDKSGLILIGIGLSAILPIAISIKQASYYQIPSLPYFALGISLILIREIRALYDWIVNNKVASAMTILIGIAGTVAGLVICWNTIGTIDRRNIEHIAIAEEISTALGYPDQDHYRLKVVGAKSNFTSSYSHYVPAYLNRYYDIYVDKDATETVLTIDTDKLSQGCPAQDLLVLVRWEGGCLSKLR